MLLKARFEGELRNITVELSGRNLNKQVVKGPE